ncbi:MAG: SEL1-like repeat protein [Alphaproteobacteria bacterium]|nr:SEL1-like repeat protein [Alphaproteobacteria bacterium]
MPPPFARRLVLAAALLAAPLPALADVASARALIARGSYEQAFYELLPLAEDQDPAAQYLIGGLYLIGHGVPQDPQEARKWLTRAAHNNHAEAAMALGDVAARGIGAKPDPAQALVWYRRAASQGVAAAQNNLGIALASGTGTGRDAKAAAQWLERAARQGNGEAQYNLGRLLSSGGQNLKANPENAVMWLAIAAKSGVKEAVAPRDLLIKKLGRKSKLPLASAQRFVARPEAAIATMAPPPAAQTFPETPTPLQAARPAGAQKSSDKASPYPALPAPRKMTHGGYKIQLASGYRQSEIAKEASRLRFEMADLLSDLEVSIIHGEAGFTALMGPFATAEEAEVLCARLKERKVKDCSTVPP